MEPKNSKQTFPQMNRGTFQKLLKSLNLKKNWIYASQVATWIISIVSTFVLSPPTGDDYNNKAVFNLSKFLVTFIIVGVFIAIIYFNRTKFLVLWILLATLSLGGGLFLWDSLMSVENKCTCLYNNDRVLIGDTLLNFKRDSGKSNEEIMLRGSGHLAKLYTTGSVKSCREKMIYLYLPTTPLFALSIISILQALGIAQQRKPPSKPKKQPHPYFNPG